MCVCKIEGFKSEGNQKRKKKDKNYSIMEDSRIAKQLFLKVEILTKGYDPAAFAEFLNDKKGSLARLLF